MIECLILECSKSCGKTFTFNMHGCDKVLHETSGNGNDTISNLSSSTTTLRDIMSLTDASAITRDMEDAVVHIAKHKMAESKCNIKQFPSGGPWV